MPRSSGIRKGSLAYWPRKRARRIYPSIRTYPQIKTYPQAEKAKLLAFAGYKAGMLHAMVVDNVKGSPSFGQEITMPVTVLDCPPLFIAGIRAYKASVHGMVALTEAWADKMPKEVENALNRKVHIKPAKSDAKLAEIEKALDNIAMLRLIAATQPIMAGFGKKKPDIFEVEIGGKTAKEKFEFAKSVLGKEIKASDVLKEGELVDVVAITTGKGTAGPVKRFGIKIQSRHAKKKRRHTGTLGQERPGKVRHTVPMAGQMGFQQRTELNKRILKTGSVDTAQAITPAAGFNRYGAVKGDYMLIEGSLAGTKKRLVLLRSAIRPRGARIVIKEVRRIVK